MRELYERRRFVVCVEVFYLLVLFALAAYCLVGWGRSPQFLPPAFLGAMPIGVPWFGALGAVIISLSGAFDHRLDWDPTWNLWHFTRPLIGISLAIIAWLTFQAGILAVGSAPAVPVAGQTNAAAQVTAPTNLLFYLIAFVVGYREAVFREMIKRVADVILTPASPDAGGGVAPGIAALHPANGRATGGDTVAIIGTGLTGTTGVSFGSNPAPSVQVVSDSHVIAICPPGDPGVVQVTVATNAGSVTGAAFVYQL